MNHIRSLLFATIVFAVAAIFAEEAKPAAAPPAPRPSARPNHGILLVNAAGLPAAQMEAIRDFAEKDLWAKVKTMDLAMDWAALPEKVPGLQSANFPVVVALGKGPASARILAAPDTGWAMVNVAPLLSLNEKQDHMLKQQTLRGIGYAIGLATCLDMYCCMRTSQALSDLKDAGYNFCPLTRGDYENLAIQKSLELRYPLNGKSKKAKAPATPAP